jgi:chromate transporter
MPYGRFKMALQLFAFFLKIGFFTFGGGWSILAQMQKEFVEKRKWITEESLLDMTLVGRSLPGMMITNISMLFGYHMGGFFCGLSALIGITLPPLIILSIVTIFYVLVKDNLYVTHALSGIRSAVVPIIASAALKMRKSAFKSWFGYFLAGSALLLCLFTTIHIGIIVLISAIIGILISGRIKL